MNKLCRRLDELKEQLRNEDRGLKISVTTETCDLIEKHLPTEVGGRIKWRPVIPGELNSQLQCLIECDPKDRCAIIATAEQHFPDKVFEVKEAFRKPTKD